MTAAAQYRLVAIGEASPNAVTVGIERHDGVSRAAVWWESKGDVDADEVEFEFVPDALDAAEAARVLHGFDEVVVALAQPDVWDQAWGTLIPISGNEPIGDIRGVDISSNESYDLAVAIETERDA
jgi:hypothetical protein